MRIQNRLLLILIGIWLVLCAALLTDARLTLTRDYDRQETKLAIKDIYRTQKATDNLWQQLVIYMQAWAQWDEAYHFMSKQSQQFIDSNFVQGTFLNSNLNFFLFYDNTGKFYYGKEYDLIKKEFVPISPALLEIINQNHNFVTHNNVKSQKVGIINLGSHKVLMGSLPVITGDGNGPIAGTMLMGYYLTNDNIKEISTTVSLPIDIINLPSDNPEINTILTALKTEKFYLKNETDFKSSGYIAIKDINDQPVYLLKINLHRTLYAEGLTTISHYFFGALVSGVLTILIMWYLLKRQIVDRILNVSNQVSKIYSQGNFEKRVTTTGNDEINGLVKSINAMLELIELTQDQLKYRISRRTRELEKISELNRNLFTEVGRQRNVESALREEEKLLKQMAYYDTLTGLPSRGFFMELLDKAITHCDRTDKLGVIFIDADGFKKINDTYGHDVGDMYLKIISERLKTTLSKYDMPGRLAGDEMIIYMSNIRDRASIDHAVKNLLESLSAPLSIQGHTLTPSFSMGISVFPDDGRTTDDLLKKADIAMYHAKKTSGNAFAYYADIENKEKKTPLTP